MDSNATPAAASAPSRPIPFLTPGTRVLVVLAAAGAAAYLARLFLGLGATTHLSDEHPWGLWIAADVLVGVALAAGGYAMSAAYYVFGMKKYHPVVRPAILTAFLGYAVVTLGLIADIGKPWAIWHPLVYGQVRSVLFEVAICVMLYLSVLALEFAPVVAEGTGRSKLRKALVALTYPLVIVGIVLSFLHQSSLGALFLLMKGRLSELWYSPILPQLFYLSSICAGISMVSFESILSSRAFRRPVETDILRGLARGAQVALALYLVVKVGDLAVRGALPLVFAGDRASAFFLLEVGAGVVLPLVLYSLGSVRRSTNGLLLASSLVLLGIVVNRFNVTLFAQPHAKASYFPALTEVAVTVGLVSFLLLAYRFLVLRLPVLPREETEAPGAAAP